MEYKVKTTDEFDAWLAALGEKDVRAQSKVINALNRAEEGNFGDHHAVGKGVSEMRLHYGPGYRVYYTIRKRIVVVVLAGGTKKTQDSDLKQVYTMLEEDDNARWRKSWL